MYFSLCGTTIYSQTNNLSKNDGPDFSNLAIKDIYDIKKLNFNKISSNVDLCTSFSISV